MALRVSNHFINCIEYNESQLQGDIELSESSQDPVHFEFPQIRSHVLLRISVVTSNKFPDPVAWYSLSSTFIVSEHCAGSRSGGGWIVRCLVLRDTWAPCELLLLDFS